MGLKNSTFLYYRTFLLTFFVIFQTYIQLSKNYYKAEPQKVNFKTAPEQSGKEVNTWVEKQTEGKLGSTPTSLLSHKVSLPFPLGRCPCFPSCYCSSQVMPSDVDVGSGQRHRKGGQRKSSALKQLQTPDLCLSELPEKIPIDSSMLCSSWSSGTTVPWCCTQSRQRRETPLPTSVLQGRGGMLALLYHPTLGRGAPPSTWCSQPEGLSASSCLP